MVIIAWETFHDASCDGLRMVHLRMCGWDSGGNKLFGVRNVSQHQLSSLELILYKTSRLFCFLNQMCILFVFLNLALGVGCFERNTESSNLDGKIEAGRAPLRCDVVKITFALAALLTVLLNFAVVGQFGGVESFESRVFFCGFKKNLFLFWRTSS